jgi:hypothetical protein
MNDPLHPALWRYLRCVQRSPRVGMHARERERAEICARTVYRWQRSLGDRLRIIPSVSVERLGLIHCHVFVTKPGDAWLSLLYAVEAYWLTPNLCRDTLYLHCLVPTAHQASVQSLLRTLPCAEQEILWSSSGWQQFLHADDVIELPTSDEHAMDATLLRSHPFVVPVLMESWQYPNSLPLIWQRTHSTLKEQVRAYLPRTRIHYTNGSSHVTSMYETLHAKGLLRQQLIRYQPLLVASIEVFVDVRMERADLLLFLGDLRSSLHAIETYPTSEGFLCRLLGPYQLFDAVLALPEHVRAQVHRLLFHRKRHPAPPVRFAYERLFNPRKGSWETTA